MVSPCSLTNSNAPLPSQHQMDGEISPKPGGEEPGRVAVETAITVAKPDHAHNESGESTDESSVKPRKSGAKVNQLIIFSVLGIVLTGIPQLIAPDVPGLLADTMLYQHPKVVWAIVMMFLVLAFFAAVNAVVLSKEFSEYITNERLRGTWGWIMNLIASACLVCSFTVLSSASLPFYLCWVPGACYVVTLVCSTYKCGRGYWESLEQKLRKCP